MIKLIRKTTALLVLTLLATSMATAQTVNMSKYITLTVRQGEQIRLDLQAAAAGTGVKIVSGSTNQTITVGTGWTNGNYTAGAGTMTVYGDIVAFDCSGNGAYLTALDVSHNTSLIALTCSGNQLTSLDVSHNTALKYFRCNGNSFTTQAFNDLMCSLPTRTTADNAKFYPLLNASDAAASAFMAANSQIATAKNWQVRYGAGGDIPATTGTYVCGGGSGSVNMSKYITLTVQQGQQIRLDLMAAAAGTPVKIVSGSNETVVTVGTSWTGYQYCTAGAGTMTVYGDIIWFDCSGNGTKLTSLDVSQNTELTRLYCGSNQLTSLNVSQNTALTWLYCYGNQLTALDVTQNTALTDLRCYGNQLTALDVTQNTALTKLVCSGNSFTTQAFNDLMCSLPTRTTADNAKFYPLWNASDAAASAFMAANSQIATAKNWQVRYWQGSEDEIPATTGTYVCGGGSGSVNMSKYITLTVQQGQQIQLDLQAAAAGTPVKIVSGSNETVVTVGTGWTGFQNYTAGAGTMTVYGDITRFDCSGNGAKLTALDVSHNTAIIGLWCYDNQLTALDVSQNTALTWLLCSGNNFTTQAFNDLMCSLPARTTADNAKFYPLDNASDAAAATFTAANSQIATAKNWQVRYGESGEIPATTGTYVCPAAGIAELASVPLLVYPNPATDILTVETEAIGAVITLTDLTGRTVATATATATATTLHISHLSAGTYIVRVGNRVGKVVKR